MKNWRFEITEDSEGYKCLMRDGKPSECYKFDVRPCTSRCSAFHYDGETVNLNCMPQPTQYGDVAETVTEEQVKDYFKSLNKEGYRDFYLHYTAKGWRIGKDKVYNWRALAQKWEDNKIQPKKNTVRGIPKRRLDCNTCGGTGKSPISNQSCRSCDGRGWIYAE